MEKNPGWCRLCTRFIAKGLGQGESEPTRSQPLAIPQLIADEPFLYTAEEQAHMGAACCTVRLTVSHMKKKEEEGICWRGMRHAEGGGWAGM